MKFILLTVILLLSTVFITQAQYTSNRRPTQQPKSNSQFSGPLTDFNQRRTPPPVLNSRPLTTRRPNTSPQASSSQPMRLVYSWNIFDYNYPNQSARQAAIDSGAFNADNVAVPAAIVASGSRAFITIPRWLHGVPATLGTIPYPSDNLSPRITPYPNWDFNRQGNCNGLTSVYRVKVDECNRLWVLDNGVINNFLEPEIICPSQIYVFDLNTDQVIHRFVFPNSVIPSDSLLVTIEVEYPNNRCGSPTEAYVYAADSDTFALVVAEMSTGHAWRIRDKTMFPSPEAGTFNVVGLSFELMDGAFGLALSPPRPNTPRILYFNAMNNFHQRWVPTSVLRNETTALNNPEAYITAPTRRSSQAGDTAIDVQGNLFFGLMSEQAVACWNINAPSFDSRYIATLAQDNETLQFPISIEVDNSNNLWVMSTSFQRYALEQMFANETNFRVFVAPTAELVRGTICAGRDSLNFPLSARKEES